MFAVRVVKFMKLSFMEKMSLLKFSLSLLLMKAFILTLSFKKILSILKLDDTTSQEKQNLNVVDQLSAEYILLEKAARYTPTHYSCLVQCLAFYISLSKEMKKKITIHLGVKKEGTLMKAHAWVSAGQIGLSSSVTLEGSFKEISSFQRVMK